MSVINEVLQANERYAHDFTPAHLSVHPARKLVVLTCMDSRLLVEQALGLQPGDAHVLRNAGGLVTEDALRSIILSHHRLGTQEIMIINHTDCGMLTLDDDELRDDLQQRTGTAVVSPASFHGFRDLEKNVKRQIQKVKSHPWLPSSLPCRGFIYDVETGRLREVYG